MRDWAALAPRLEDAIASARRLNADEALARLSRARAQLSGSLPEHLAGTGVVRLPTLESQLAAWLELVDATGLSFRTGRLLGEASVQVRSRAWMAIGVLSVVMVVLRQRFPAGALLMLAGAAYVWVRSTFRYRLFPDALVVERDGEPPIDVPLKSFERGEASPGVTLRGLVDVELPAVEQLRPFCVLINRVMAERQALVDEQKALARVAGPLGEWLNATWRPRDVEVPASVEVLKFEKDEGPVRMVAGSESKSSKGAALVLDRGLLFVPQRAQSRVREILFETAWIDLLTEERVPLGRVPKQLFIDRLEALRGLAEVRWLAEIRLDPDQRQVVLPDGTLSLKR